MRDRISSFLPQISSPLLPLLLFSFSRSAPSHCGKGGKGISVVCGFSCCTVKHTSSCIDQGFFFSKRNIRTYAHTQRADISTDFHSVSLHTHLKLTTYTRTESQTYSRSFTSSKTRSFQGNTFNRRSAGMSSSELCSSVLSKYAWAFVSLCFFPIGFANASYCSHHVITASNNHVIARP